MYSRHVEHVHIESTASPCQRTGACVFRRLSPKESHPTNTPHYIHTLTLIASSHSANRQVWKHGGTARSSALQRLIERRSGFCCISVLLRPSSACLHAGVASAQWCSSAAALPNAIAPTRGVVCSTCVWSQAAALLLVAADAFYLPGIAPREYADGERVDVRVHKLSSPKTQLPYDYYSLPFCKPAEVSCACCSRMWPRALY